MAKQILYLVYGDNEAYRHEAKFSILTLLDCLGPRTDIDILVMTDRAQDYVGWPVEAVQLSPATMEQWLGTYNYNHRRKPCAISAALRRNKDTLFVDTDTYFVKSPESLFRQISQGIYLIDQFEWCWGRTASFPTFKGLRADLVARGQIPPDTLRLYNSGVCGLQPSDLELIEKSTELIDQWAAHCHGNHVIEQVALSFMLHGKQVEETKNYIYHYFPKKKYLRAMLKAFFQLHGEDFRKELPALTREVPKGRFYPPLWQRAWVKWHIRHLDGPSRGFARLLLYGCLSDEPPYMESCQHIWWDRLLKGGCPDPRFREAILNDRWPVQIPYPKAKADQTKIALAYLKPRLAERRA